MEIKALAREMSVARFGKDEAGFCTSSVDDVGAWKDIAEIYKQNKLEVKIRHSSTCVSRIKIIAPNWATARGLTGHLLLDEIAFIPDFKRFLSAVDPIISRQAKYKMIMATTLPDDDAHYAFELAAAPVGMVFEPNAEGTFYKSQAGMWVHRVDAQDAHAAGVPLFNDEGQLVTPDEHRAEARDKDAWDLNYALKFPMGGTTAISMTHLRIAQETGAALGCQFYEGELPDGWARGLEGKRLALGYDPASTENDKSNPSVISVLEKLASGLVVTHRVLRFKSQEARVHRRHLCEMRDALSPFVIAVDATGGGLWASDVEEWTNGRVPVLAVKGSESKKIGYNLTSTIKTYTAKNLVTALEDGLLALPPDDAVKADFRLIKRKGSGYVNQLDASGSHGDIFDSVRLGYYGVAFADAGAGVREPRNSDFSVRLQAGDVGHVENSRLDLVAGGRRAVCRGYA